MLRLYRSIATMDASAPLPDLPDQAPTWAQASDLVLDRELSQLADRLQEMAKVNHRRGAPAPQATDGCELYGPHVPLLRRGRLAALLGPEAFPNGRSGAGERW